MTTDTLVAEGVRQYLLEHQLTIPIISFDSIKPRLDIEAYIDINVKRNSTWVCSPLNYQGITKKENRLLPSIDWLIPYMKL